MGLAREKIHLKRAERHPGTLGSGTAVDNSGCTEAAFCGAVGVHRTLCPRCAKSRLFWTCFPRWPR